MGKERGWKLIVGRGVYRSYKGHRDKIKGEGRRGGGRWDWLGWRDGEKMQTTAIE